MSILRAGPSTATTGRAPKREPTFAGVPFNVTLLFSREQYLAAAEASLRGIERRIDAGLKPEVGSVASVFVSRWDGAVASTVSDSLKNRLGVADAHVQGGPRPGGVPSLAESIRRRRTAAAPVVG
jgi:hypothetical protein